MPSILLDECWEGRGRGTSKAQRSVPSGSPELMEPLLKIEVKGQDRVWGYFTHYW